MSTSGGPGAADGVLDPVGVGELAGDCDAVAGDVGEGIVLGGGSGLAVGGGVGPQASTVPISNAPRVALTGLLPSRSEGGTWIPSCVDKLSDTAVGDRRAAILRCPDAMSRPNVGGFDETPRWRRPGLRRVLSFASCHPRQ